MLPGDSPPLWSILIPTLAYREEKFLRLLGTLLSLARQAPAAVEVVALRNYGEKTISEYRQALLDDARGEFVSFVDDDDEVSPDYADSVVSALLSGADVVGFEVDCEGLSARKTLLSVRHWGAPWEALFYEGELTYLRYTTHLCPVRTALARKAAFAGQQAYGEDRLYSLALHPLLEDATEAYIPRPLYRYIWNAGDTSADRAGFTPPPIVSTRRHQPRPLPVVQHPCFRWHPWSLMWTG